GIRRDAGLVENTLGAGEDRFRGLPHRLEPARLLGMDMRLLVRFVLWIGGASEFEQLAGQRWRGVQEAHPTVLTVTHEAAYIRDSAVRRCGIVDGNEDVCRVVH